MQKLASPYVCDNKKWLVCDTNILSILFESLDPQQHSTNLFDMWTILCSFENRIWKWNNNFQIDKKLQLLLDFLL